MSWGVLIAAAVAQLMGNQIAITLGLALFVAGLAHGAGDENDNAIRVFRPVHVFAYIVAGSAVAAIFLLAPTAGITLFLALSAWHFARSDSAMHQTVRLAIAGLAIGGSALFRLDETAAVFIAIAGGPVTPLLAGVAAMLGAAGVGAAVWALARARRGAAHAIVALLATAFLQPVLAVGVIFLTAHAIPVQQRQIRRYGSAAVWHAVAVPTVIASLGAAAIAYAVWAGLMALPLAAALAFGLATPHMLTERLERC